MHFFLLFAGATYRYLFILWGVFLSHLPNYDVDVTHYLRNRKHISMEVVHNKSVLRLSPSNSSDSSASSSALLSMCPLSMDMEHSFHLNDQSFLTNSKCSKEKSSLQVCSNDTESIYSDSSSLSRDEQSKPKRTRSLKRLTRLFNQQSDVITPISADSCLTKLLFHPKLNIEIEPPTPIAIPPPSPPSISPDRIDRSKKRQMELDRTADKLIETIQYEANKNIEQIFQYWSHIKYISLEKYQPKLNPHYLFDYLFNCNYFTQNYDIYLEQNDEIKAALQVLSTTLSIVHEEQSFAILNDIFDMEEKTARENLQYRLNYLIESYREELSIIRHSIQVYQSCTHEDKSFDWIQMIQIEYPCFIEKLSNDFNIKLPQIESNLLQLIRNTKKALVNLHGKH